MLARRYRPIRWSRLLGGVLAVCLLHAAPILAQSADQGDDTGSSYRIGEKTSTKVDVAGTPAQATGAQANTAPPADLKTQGPVRMARISSASGNVTWRADDGMEWSKATVNLPLRQGAQVWVTDGGRANVQFDDGSELRLGNGAVATLKILYSDAKGEFTQINMTDGLATLRTRRDESVYQVDMPLVSIKSSGAAQIRFGVDAGSEIAVQRGNANVDGAQGKITLHEGDYLDLTNADTPYKPTHTPPADSWDRWNVERNRLIDTKSETDRHVPPNIGLMAGDLDNYGSWREDPRYGWVWVPRVASPDWRPYHDGQWTWVEPFGWTWVGDEAWGWAPYHYGTWVDQPYGWAWCPGPAYQYWSPAVVDFSVYGGNIGWAPLCPWEVRYPVAFGLGYWGNNWCFSFSIGCAGIYYPWGAGYCVGRPFGNYYANHWGYGRWDHGQFGHDGFGHGYGGYDHNSLVRNQGFVPYNARHAAGATMASATTFGGRGNYQAVPRGQTTLFTRGQVNGLPTAGRAPLSGPASVQPTRQAMTPTHSFLANTHPAQSALQRDVYHASLPSSVQRSLPSTAVQRSSTGSGAAAQARTSVSTQGMAGRTNAPDQNRGAINASIARGTDSHTSTAAEAARQARASLGYTGRGSSAGYTQNSGRFGGQGYSGGYQGRYSGSAGNSSGRTYAPSGSYNGSSGGSYRRSESSGGGGYRGGGSSSGGGYRGGGGSSGGGSGGGSHGGGGGRGR